MEQKEITEIFSEHDLRMGRLMSMSKSGYRENYPDNLVVFNANIFTEGRGKIWHGDLDVTKSEDVLSEIANEINETIYVLREMDGRFGEEDKHDISKLLERSVWSSKE